MAKKTIEMFGGPLDGLPLDDIGPDLLEFAYADLGNGNFKVSSMPSSPEPPTFFDAYERTERKTREGRIVFQYNPYASNPPS